jgi:hypothetical protein
MKFSVTLLSVALAAVALCSIPAAARLNSFNNPQETKAATKETKMQGHVVRIYKDLKTIDLRGGTTARAEDVRKVVYDDQTEWTKLGKPGKMEDVKEDSFIIVLGHLQKDGALHATRIDLRLPR